MMRSSFQLLGLGALCLGTSFCATSQLAPSQLPSPSRAPLKSVAPAKLPLGVLIVSGGPSPDYNQYAIESNARYLEKLTSRARWQRVLFADGRKTSRTISALSTAKGSEQLLGWLLDWDAPPEHLTYHAPALRRIDGPSTQKSVLAQVEQLASAAKAGQSSLLYFTGHGGPGRKMRLSLSGLKSEDDFENTNYALWNREEVDVKTLAKSLEKWPPDAPLVLVMVQCHAGGFANLLFEDGDPKAAVVKRNFCGFFAATGERQASGCTSEVNEVDYQDFTTHFFAALSGVSRDGRRITGADWDKNGAVSLLEAFAWTNLHDQSIDVPLCTSDAYLRSIWPAEVAPDWVKTPYSSLIQDAAPWQRATLEGLSGALRLRGENRIQSALSQRASAARAMDDSSSSGARPASLDSDATWKRYYGLRAQLKKRFPSLVAPHNSARFQAARRGALRFLESPQAGADVAALSRVLNLWNASGESAPTREAQDQRFVRAARTLFLEKKLNAEGTPEQKSVFSQLRSAENRNPLR